MSDQEFISSHNKRILDKLNKDLAKSLSLYAKDKANTESIRTNITNLVKQMINELNSDILTHIDIVASSDINNPNSVMINLIAKDKVGENFILKLQEDESRNSQYNSESEYSN